MIFALMVLALVGAALVLVAQSSGSMTFQTRRMTYEARVRDLQASARAWAATHPGRRGPTALDTDALGIPSGGLKVTIAADGEVRVEATCVLRGRPVTRRRAFRPPRRP